MIVRKINGDYNLIKYKKNKLNQTNQETLGLFRSVIVNDAHVVCYAPPKSLTENHFNDWILPKKASI